MSDEILVTGGTGNIGTAFVALLASDARRPRVRVATRNPDSPQARVLRAMNPETVRPVAVDEKDPGSLRKAFEGVTGLFVIAPFVPDIGAWHEPIARAAAESGTCRRIVKASVTGARSPASDPAPGRIPLSHWLGEEALRKTGIATTAIRPTMYMQHFLTVPAMYTAGADRFHLPTGAAKVAFLDCRDIAALAAAVLLADAATAGDYAGKAWELSGPEAIDAASIATILSGVAGRPVTHVDGEEALVARCRDLGAPDAVKYIYREAAGGWFAALECDAFARVTGRRPRSFAEFALDHAGYFRPR
jgi:uncharacterized protein YbjT (DUF2867 family)